MAEKFIPYGRQHIDDEDIQAVVEVLRSDYLTTGPKIEEFEQKFAEYVGTKYAVAISNGTAALHAACYAAGISDGDEVITTPITFAASANAVLYCGGRPIFADIDEITYNIDPEEIKKKITPKTKAIIPVHYTGQACDMDKILEIAQKNKLIVIEDAAHALGAEYCSRKIGSIAHMTTFSFHPVKHITTGEGGMITTNDEELYRKLLLFRAHGITRQKNLLHKKHEGSWYYEQLELGYNYRMTDIQSALGISQLKKIEQNVDRRREIAERYNDAFRTADGVVIPFQADYQLSSWHLYVILLDNKLLKGKRKEIFNALREAGVGVNVHYIPVYYFPYYEQLGYMKGLCPNAEAFYENAITLPLYPQMDDEEIEYVIEYVIKTINIFIK